MAIKKRQDLNSRPTILIIDDEKPVREAVKDILALVEIEVLEAPDGRSGISIYRQNQPQISLILLDLSMPGISGEETFHELRQLNPDVRVLLSSGYNESDVNSRLVGQNITGFIQKPYTLDALINKVQQHLD
ncbi:MAG: response regulator [Anaerolineales bacterium]|nr:response regulator [Anaerolineales bacterium]MCA9928375.1 response regulator [Anaerolineales bacterium]